MAHPARYQGLVFVGREALDIADQSADGKDYTTGLKWRHRQWLVSIGIGHAQQLVLQGPIVQQDGLALPLGHKPRRMRDMKDDDF
jgi:hypothetical protein